MNVLIISLIDEIHRTNLFSPTLLPAIVLCDVDMRDEPVLVVVLW